MLETGVEIRFELSLNDLREFRHLHFRKYRMPKILAILGICFLCVTVALYKPGLDPVKLIEAYLICFLVFGLMFGMYRFRETRLPRDAVESVSAQVLKVTRNAIKSNDLFGEVTIEWPQVLKVYDAPQTFYLYLTSSIALIVPKRAFTTDAAILEFRRILLKNVSRVDS